MNTPITLFLLGGWWPLLRSFGLLMATVGLGLIMMQARHAMMPVDAEVAEAIVVPGALAFLLPAVIAGILTAALWELRNCPFAWSTPALAQRTARELLISGVAMTLVAWVVGMWLYGPFTSRSFFPAILASLGVAVGVLNMDPPGWWQRFGGLSGLLAATVPLFFLPEMGTILSHGAPLWLLGAFGLMIGALHQNHRRAVRRPQVPPDAPWSWTDHAWRRWIGDSGPDARLFGTSDMSSAAPRDGAARFIGVRKSNGDWLRALLHESYGAARGGLVGRSARWAIAAMVLAAALHVACRSIGNLRVADDVPMQAVAIMLGILVMGASLNPELGVNHPLSRRRRAWIVWLRTQIEELAMLVAMVVALLAMTAFIDRFGTRDAWAHLNDWAMRIVAVVSLLPLARWVRLRLVDTRQASPTRAMRVEGQDGSLILAMSLGISVLIAGGTLLAVAWGKLHAILLASTPPSLHILAPLVVIPVIVLLRWLWLVALVRYHMRGDLPA